jgi:hypothetical protein
MSEMANLSGIWFVQYDSLKKLNTLAVSLTVGKKSQAAAMSNYNHDFHLPFTV